MLSLEAVRVVEVLRALLLKSRLPQLGIVDVGMGSRLSFESAVRVTLADLARFTAWEHVGRDVDADRWCQLSEDLVRLHRMAVGAPDCRVRVTPRPRRSTLPPECHPPPA
jgi:hypothetical protein